MKPLKSFFYAQFFVFLFGLSFVLVYWLPWFFIVPFAWLEIGGNWSELVELSKIGQFLVFGCLGFLIVQFGWLEIGGNWSELVELPKIDPMV